MKTDEFFADETTPIRCFEITQIPYPGSLSGSFDKDLFQESKILLMQLYDEIYAKENSSITFEQLNILVKAESKRLLLDIYTLEVERYISIIERSFTHLVLILTPFGVCRAEFTNNVFG